MKCLYSSSGVDVIKESVQIIIFSVFFIGISALSAITLVMSQYSLCWLQERGIPILIFSAGLADIIEEVNTERENNYGTIF